jgi:uncharacterized RDD family membrane protein YckC
MTPRIYQTFWPRFWAGWIDAAVLLPLTLLDDWVWAVGPSPLAGLLWFSVSSLSWGLYSILLHAYRGQTAGKYLMGVRVIDVSGAALSLRQAVLRDSIWVLATLVEIGVFAPMILGGRNPYDAESPLSDGYNLLMAASVGWMLLEFGSMLFSAKRRAVHDLIAGSVVVRVRGIEPSPVL